ncbi:MAG: ABC transporter substrate-binding protein [Candidatus Synoicihabitans palmerolidicus]|nr:ABC transporter substrate-binding protein [Candidatus Synoicihabitans palmerolidicus]
MIRTQGQTNAVRYRLERSPAGWRIHDLLIEGVSFVANYRAQFDAIFQKGGPAAVLNALESKHTDVPASSPSFS